MEWEVNQIQCANKYGPKMQSYCWECGAIIIEGEITRVVVINGHKYNEVLLTTMDGVFENGGGRRDLCRLFIAMGGKAPTISTYQRCIFLIYGCSMATPISRDT